MIAKNLYVETRSGWFSDRSACYLASGRPGPRAGHRPRRAAAQRRGAAHVHDARRGGRGGRGDRRRLRAAPRARPARSPRSTSRSRVACSAGCSPSSGVAMSAGRRRRGAREQARQRRRGVGAPELGPRPRAARLDVRFVERARPPGRPGRGRDRLVRRRSTERFGLAGRATLLRRRGRDRRAGRRTSSMPSAPRRGAGQHQRPPRPPRRSSTRSAAGCWSTSTPASPSSGTRTGCAGARVEGHDSYFTIGELIGTPGCPIPTAGIDWRPVAPAGRARRLAAQAGTGDRAASRRSRPGAGRSGRSSTAAGPTGSRSTSSASSSSCPPHRRIAFEIALDIHPGDDADLRGPASGTAGELADPRGAAGDPDAFRAYVQGSAAEFSVAQGVYVDTRCGWFSDRTVRYLASGRPALVQDTGFSRDPPGRRGAGRLPDARGGRRGRRGHRRALRRARPGRPPDRRGALRGRARPARLLRAGRGLIRRAWSRRT